MQSTPANWDTYFTNPIHTTEYQIIISEKDGSGPITYGVNVIRSASIESALLTADMWIGNAVARCLTMTVLSEVDVPRMAKIVIQCRLGVGESYTDYMSIGTFWVDERDKGSLWTNLVCYDSMLICDQPFINVDLEEGEWPLSMVEAVTEICARTALTLDARTTILTGTDYVVPYTNDLSMREVLGYIASCHGGNWTITPEGKLRLIVLSSPSESPIHVLGQSIKSFREMGNAILLSKLTMYDDAENVFSAGDDTEYHIEIDCPYATINIVNDLCNTADGILYGVKYTPFEATNARLNPLAELGDDISVGGVTSVLNKIEIRIGASYIADISCPGDEEVDHEYPYLSTIQRASNRTVKQNASYYGTTISRKDGLTIERLENGDVKAKVLFNSDKLAMQALESGVLVDKVYFDPAQGTYVFDGVLSADVIQALSAVITPNLYAEKATIAELTVDQLDTSTKVQNYLNGSTADVNYIKIREQYIDFITASTDGVQDEQATDRNGMDLYWTDETCTATTTEDTGLPVMVYVYDENVKRQIHFYNDGTNEIPRDVWGYGSGSGDNDKFFIYKPANKTVLEYFNPESGKRTAIELSDFVDANMRRLKSAVINKTAGTIAVTMEGKATAETIDYTETASSMTFTWPDDFDCTISIA